MRDFIRLLPFFACGIAFVGSVQYDPFFWDTVQLASKHAHHFYDNGLRWTPLPPEIDSGHPPVFGYYLALVWTCFGKTLPASHWAMLPFILLNIGLIYRIGQRAGSPRWAFWLLPLILLDPVVAGQHALVSPDVVLICGFLMAVSGMLERRRWLLSAGVFILCLVSMRGMMTAGALFVSQILLLQEVKLIRPVSKKKVLRLLRAVISGIPPYVPGFVFAAWYLWWHHAATGWTGYHAGSPWAPAFEKAGASQMLKNIAVVGWRWLDFGRICEWLLIAWLVFRGGDGRQHRDNKKLGTGVFFILCICLTVLLTPSALLFQNLSAHRYFLPCFLAFHLFVFSFINHVASATTRAYLFAALIAGFAFGNRWIYPRGISMGWDATLAHLPYHRLRAEAVAFLDSEKIPFEKVGSAFPNLNTGEQLLLNGDNRRFAEKDLARNEYIFSSNIFNDFSEKDLDLLQKHWLAIKHFEQAGVWIDIYRRRH